VSGLPIRFRVTAALALAMALVLAGSGWFLYARLDSHLATALDTALKVRADDLGTLLRQPGASLAEERGGGLIERGESFAQLLDRRGRVLDATRPLQSAPLLTPAELQAAGRRSIYTDRSSVPGLNEPSRLLATPVERGGQRLVLVVGATSQNDAETLASFRDELLIAGPIALVLASIAGYFLAGLSLRQVESMRLRAAAISADTPGERLPVPPTRDELERLGSTLNAMLGRLEAGLQRERDLVADAGHELRTPLALLRTELELALRHGRSPEELRLAVRASMEEVDRLAQLADDLLLIARYDRGRLPLRVESLDAGELVSSVVRRFQWRADESARPLAGQAPPGLQLRGDRIRLEQALGNLVDNALRYGRGRVSLRATGVDGTIELHVEDQGDGFRDGCLERAFERFSRAQHGVEGSGAGLGLSIARVIAEAHGGTAEAENLPAGGAHVRISLPAD
jgi:two-component system OmpR family sensor kinase